MCGTLDAFRSAYWPLLPAATILEAVFSFFICALHAEIGIDNRAKYMNPYAETHAKT